MSPDRPPTRVGVVLPTTEFGTDPGVRRAWVAALEDLGFHHVHLWDHVLGAGLASRPGWKGTWDSSHHFDEPLTTMAWLAGLTTEVELVSGVLILPQRQTALVAKQAAQVSELSGGRLRLGVAAGHNEPEFEALGHDFHRRGARLDEQIQLLRRLWTEETVSHEGRFDRLPDVGINPRPSTPIPVWVGGSSAAAVNRVATLSDGWIGRGRPVLDATLEVVEAIRTGVAQAGRAPDAVGIDGRIDIAVLSKVTERHPTQVSVPPDEWASDADAWCRAGATHVTFNPLWAGMHGEEHVAFLERLAAVVPGDLR